MSFLNLKSIINKKHIEPAVAFDPDRQYAVIKCSICNGEQVAGFKNKADGSFTEVMLIQSEADLDMFKQCYQIEEIKKEY